MKVLFVVNPKAGSQYTSEMYNKLSHFALSQGIDYKFYLTQGSGDAKRIQISIKEFQPSTVVAVGGDGTINLVASQLIHRRINFGIVPTGSANGLAYNLNIPNKIDIALRKLVEKKPKPIDAILINEKYHCFHLSDTGINARLVKRFEKQGSKGLAGYGKQLIKELFAKNTSFFIDLSTQEGQKEYIKAEMVVIANAKSYGTGAMINPLGKPDDGKFEIVIIKPYPWWFILRSIVSFFTGKLHNLKYVNVQSEQKASINFKMPHDFQIDGELVEGVTMLKLKIIPGALRVLY